MPAEHTAAEIRRVAILIAGMHRSGTSALTRVLSLSGAALPKRLYLETEGNPTGHWEPERVIALHEAALAEMGSSHDDPLSIADSWFGSGEARILVHSATSFLEDEFAEESLFVMKDPRLCLFLPVWYEALDAFGADARTILILRNPLEVVESLRARNGWDDQKSLLLWLKHVLQAERHSRAHIRACTEYDSVLRDWRSVLQDLMVRLDLPIRRGSVRQDALIDDFLRDTLRHQVASSRELAARADVGEWVKDAYQALLLLNTQEAASQATLDQIRAAWLQAERAFGPLVARADLRFQQASSQLSQLTSEFGDLRRHAASGDSDLAEKASELELARTSLEQSEASVASLAASVRSLEFDVTRLGRELELTLASIAQSEATAAVVASCISSLELEVAHLRQQLESTAASLAHSEAKNASLISSVQSHELEVARMSGELAEAITRHERELATAKAASAQLEHELATGTARSTLLEQELATGTAKSTLLEQELATAQAKSTHLEQKLATAKAKLDRLEQEQAFRNASLQAKTAEATSMRRSWSWRLTSPLRRVRDAFEMVRGGRARTLGRPSLNPPEARAAFFPSAKEQTDHSATSGLPVSSIQETESP